MQMHSVAVGHRCPFPVVQGACALTLGGSFEWLLGDQLSALDAIALRTGRVDMAFRRVLFEGQSLVYSAIRFHTRPPLAGDSFVSYQNRFLEPLPSASNLSYSCTLLAVDVPSQVVVAMRMIGFSRAIGELLEEVYRTGHTPTDEERVRAALSLRTQQNPNALFRDPPSGNDYLWQSLTG